MFLVGWWRGGFGTHEGLQRPSYTPVAHGCGTAYPLRPRFLFALGVGPMAEVRAVRVLFPQGLLLRSTLYVSRRMSGHRLIWVAVVVYVATAALCGVVVASTDHAGWQRLFGGLVGVASAWLAWIWTVWLFAKRD